MKVKKIKLKIFFSKTLKKNFKNFKFFFFFTFDTSKLCLYYLNKTDLCFDEIYELKKYVNFWKTATPYFRSPNFFRKTKNAVLLEPIRVLSTPNLIEIVRAVFEKIAIPPKSYMGDMR